MSARAIFLISAFYHDLEYSQAIIGTPPIFFPLPLRNCQLPLKNGRSKTNEYVRIKEGDYRFHYGRPNRRARAGRNVR